MKYLRYEIDSKIYIIFQVTDIMNKWEILDSEKILDTKWLVVEKHKCKINSEKIIDDFYVVKKRDFVVTVKWL